MVDAFGHVAFGLLFALPAWFVWRGRVSLLFVVLVAGAALVPDADVYLAAAFPSFFHHHGVTHTILFAVLMGIVGGGLVAWLLEAPIDEWTQGDVFDRRSQFGFAAAAITLGGLSHLFGDWLSAPDISTPIEPFWPLYAGQFGADLIWYNSVWFNSVLLLVAVATHVGVVLVVNPFDQPPSAHPISLP